MKSEEANEIVKTINSVTAIIDAGFKGDRSFWFKYKKDFWTPSVAEASADCRPGRFDYTRASFLQEEKEKQFARSLKIQIRIALGKRAKGIKLFAINTAHHDKLQEVDGGVVFNK